MKQFLPKRLDGSAKIKLTITAITLLLWLTPVPRLHLSKHPTPTSFAIVLPPVPPPTAPIMNQLSSRPLFTETRRPPPASPPAKTVKMAPTAPIPTTTGMTLLGVLNTGRKAVALVSISGQAQPALITLGGTIGPWTVTAILPDRISVRTGHTMATLCLPHSSPTTTTVANAPPFPFSPPHNFPGMPSPP